MCSTRVKKNDGRMIINGEHTRKYRFNGLNFIECGVVDTGGFRCCLGSLGSVVVVAVVVVAIVATNMVAIGVAALRALRVWAILRKLTDLATVIAWGRALSWGRLLVGAVKRPLLLRVGGTESTPRR